MQETVGGNLRFTFQHDDSNLTATETLQVFNGKFKLLGMMVKALTSV